MWSFEALATGQWPRVRHDGTPFTEREAFRAAQGATLLPKGCLVYLNGDWSEFVHIFGLPSWNSNFHPCSCYSASADELGEVGATSVVRGPYPDTTFDDYDRACADCEFKVVVNTRVDLHRLAGCLHFDQRSKGNHGRTLSVALPSLGLLEGDRLEPSASLMNVGQLESVTTFPLWLTFWRQANETSARHRNPLFSRETHTSPCSTALDSRHCLHLGVYKDYCMIVMVKCILADAWKLGTSTKRGIERKVRSIRGSLSTNFRT